MWVFFLLNKTSVLYVEYKMILFAWSFCMNIYFIFFFQMNCAILLSCIINLIIINLIFLYTTAEIGALSLSVVCATCLHVWLWNSLLRPPSPQPHPHIYPTQEGLKEKTDPFQTTILISPAYRNSIRRLFKIEFELLV